MDSSHFELKSTYLGFPTGWGNITLGRASRKVQVSLSGRIQTRKDTLRWRYLKTTQTPTKGPHSCKATGAIKLECLSRAIKFIEVFQDPVLMAFDKRALDLRRVKRTFRQDGQLIKLFSFFFLLHLSPYWHSVLVYGTFLKREINLFVRVSTSCGYSLLMTTGRTHCRTLTVHVKG